MGVYCDGPLCNDRSNKPWIVGVRYKCSVCDNLDFCESCVESRSNPHDRSHSLIKYKTAVGDVRTSTVEDKLKKMQSISLLSVRTLSGSFCIESFSYVYLQMGCNVFDSVQFIILASNYHDIFNQWQLASDLILFFSNSRLHV